MSPSRLTSPSYDSSIDNHMDDHSTREVSSLKRRLAALQREVDEAASAHIKKPPYVPSIVIHNPLPNNCGSTTTATGRGIRRLVSLFEPIDSIIAEADYRIQVENDGSQFPLPCNAEEVEAKLV